MAIFFSNVSPIVSPMSDWRASGSGRILARSLELSGASFGRPSQGCFRGHLETRLESNLEGSVGWIWDLYDALSGQYFREVWAAVESMAWEVFNHLGSVTKREHDHNHRCTTNSH